MNATDPTEIVVQLAKAINERDIEAAVASYEPGARFVARPGQVVTGSKAIREALGAFIAMKPTLVMEKQEVIESGNVALFLSKWSLKGTGPDGKPVQMSGTSTDLLRRQPNGRWLIALDNPWGPAILG